MSPRPRSLTIIGWLFVAVGATGLVYGLLDLDNATASRQELLDLGYATVSRLVAILGGALLLRGAPWARWILVAWLAFHVVLGAFHSFVQFAVHAVLMAIVCFFMFRSGSRR